MAQDGPNPLEAQPSHLSFVFTYFIFVYFYSLCWFFVSLSELFHRAIRCSGRHYLTRDTNKRTFYAIDIFYFIFPQFSYFFQISSISMYSVLPCQWMLLVCTFLLFVIILNLFISVDDITVQIFFVFFWSFFVYLFIVFLNSLFRVGLSISTYSLALSFISFL